MKKIFLTILLMTAAMVLFADGAADKGPFSLTWEVSGDFVEFSLTAETEGWIAVGFNPGSMMKDADIKIGYVESSGNVVLEDHFGNGRVSHRSDESLKGSTDLEILGGQENGGFTTIRFRMPLNSGDDKDQVLVPGSRVKLIFAMGRGDNLRVKHSERTSLEVVF